MAAVVVATGKGLYVSPDSVFYVGTARSLLEGRGWTPPPGLPSVDHFPPVFTLALAGVGRLGPDPLDAARVVNVVACGAIIALVGFVLRRQTGSVTAALAGSVLALLAVDLLTFSAAALSEPLFVLLGLAGLVALAAYLDSRRPALFAVATALVAAAVLTRYVGVALVVAGCAALVHRGARRRLHGAVDAAVFAGVVAVPVLGWMVWAGRAGRTGTPAGADRALALHLPDLDYVGQAVRPLARWVVPLVPPGLGLALAVAVVVAGVIVLRRPPGDPAVPVRGSRRIPPRFAHENGASPRAPMAALPWLLGAFAVAYLAVLVVDRAVLDASGRLDARFLAPLHVVAILLVVPPVYRAWRAGRVPGAALAVAAAVMALLVVDAAAWMVGGITDVGISRRGYTAEAWRRSDVVTAVAATDAGEPVYTNGFDAVFLLTGRKTLALPAERDHLTGRVNPRYAEELDAIRRRGGLVAYFSAVTARRSFLPSQAELEAALPLERVATDDVGTLFRLTGPEPRSGR